ncbi:MAG: hypothetical protein WC901_04880 [Candidatus Margulisiibacteriota bacterium]
MGGSALVTREGPPRVRRLLSLENARQIIDRHKGTLPFREQEIVGVNEHGRVIPRPFGLEEVKKELRLPLDTTEPVLASVGITRAGISSGRLWGLSGFYKDYGLKPIGPRGDDSLDGSSLDYLLYSVALARLGRLEECAYLPVRSIVGEVEDSLAAQLEEDADLTFENLGGASAIVAEVRKLGLTSIELGMVTAGIAQHQTLKWRIADPIARQRHIQDAIMLELKDQQVILAEDGDIVENARTFLESIHRSTDFYGTHKGNYWYSS